MHMPISRSLALVSALFVAGCNAPGERDPATPPLDYFCARGLDFMDIFEINLSAGTGLFAAAAVEPVRAGFGYYDASKFGMQGRSCGVWEEDRKELCLVLSNLGWWRKQPCTGNGYLFDPDEFRRAHYMPDASEPGRKPFYEEWGWTTRLEDWERPWLDVNVEAHVLFIGVDVGISVQDTFDFVLGIFGVDTISHDDFAAEPELETEPATRSGPPISRPPLTD